MPKGWIKVTANLAKDAVRHPQAAGQELAHLARAATTPENYKFLWNKFGPDTYEAKSPVYRGRGQPHYRPTSSMYNVYQEERRRRQAKRAQNLRAKETNKKRTINDYYERPKVQLNRLTMSGSNPDKVKRKLKYKGPQHVRGSLVKFVPYQPKSHIERGIQPMVQWEEFQQNTVLSATTGKQTITQIGMNNTVRGRLRDIYQKFGVDIQGLTLRGANTTITSINSSNLPPLLCHGYDETWTILSTCTMETHLEIWELECTEGNDTLPVSYWIDDLANITCVNLDALPSDTIAPLKNKGYAKTVYMPGERPTKRCKNFWRYYRCVKKTKLTIPAGKLAYYKTSLPGFAISQNNLFENSESNIQGLTRIFMVFQWGPTVYNNLEGNQPLVMADTSLAIRRDYTCKFSVPPTLRRFYRWKVNSDWADPAGANYTEWPDVDPSYQSRVLRSWQVPTEMQNYTNNDADGATTTFP